MSTTKVSIDKMTEEIQKGLQEYAELATSDMKKAVKKAGTTAKQEIQNNAPKDTGKYAKSWTSKTTKETNNALEVTVYSPSRYYLAHLLEYGHAKRGGGRIAGKSHIAPAEEKAIDQLEQEIEKKLQNG
jgi:hypothetical protein